MVQVTVNCSISFKVNKGTIEPNSTVESYAAHVIEHLIFCAAQGYIDFSSAENIRLERADYKFSPNQPA